MAGTADALAAHAGALDRLDVVPRPDGDTGRNLASSARLVAVALAEARCRDLTTASDVMRRATTSIPADVSGISGSLLGAFLRGTTEVTRNLDAIDPMALAMAFEAGADAMSSWAESSLDAVLPGSMVTVVHAVTAAALVAADDGLALAEVAVRAADAGLDALEHTPELSPELAEAGVVDAGAAGFLVLLDVLVAVIHGEELEVEAYEFDDGAGDDDSEWGRYVVGLDLETTARGAEQLSTVWATLGESVSIVPEGAIDPEGASGPDGVCRPTRWTAQVVTDEIGAVIEAAISFGRPSGIVVADRYRPRSGGDHD